MTYSGDGCWVVFRPGDCACVRETWQVGASGLKKNGIIGAVAGMLMAGVVAFVFAFEESTFVRWAIMAVGLVAGYGVGRLLGRT